MSFYHYFIEIRMMQNDDIHQEMKRQLSLYWHLLSFDRYINNNYNITLLKQNWLQFALLAKATAIKQQKICPQIQHTEAIYHIDTSTPCWPRLTQTNSFLPLDALQCKARYCYRMSTVCLSVSLSICLWRWWIM